MYKMILDTSTKILYVGLVKDDKVVDEVYQSGKNDHAKNLFVVINNVLEKEGIKITDLDSIICGVGPGSYTGVRMAVTVGKMLASNSNVKLYGISSLYLMSSFYDGKVIAYIDARRGNSFCAAFIDHKYYKEDLLRNTKEFIDELGDFKLIDEDSFKVDPMNVIKNATLCESPHGFMPNYLRETEAERNKAHD